jgi:hypothetical protein
LQGHVGYKITDRIGGSTRGLPSASRLRSVIGVRPAGSRGDMVSTLEAVPDPARGGISVHVRRASAKIGRVPILPRSDCSLLVRTDFTSDEDWEQVSGAAQAKYEDGFQAYIEPVSDPAFESVPWQVVKAALPPNDRGALVLFVADSTTLTSHDHPILVVDLVNAGSKSPFRCIAAELWAVENNLNIANMDWEDFADAADADGVFRGFREYSVRRPLPGCLWSQMTRSLQVGAQLAA